MKEEKEEEINFKCLNEEARIVCLMAGGVLD